MHNDFTLFTRIVPSGKKVVYYYAYDDEGRRLGPWTTGQSGRTAARNYCNLLNRKGKLLQGLSEIPAFGEFAAVFWDWVKSPYLKERRKRRELTQSYADKNKRATEHTLVPYFGKMKLDKITGELIDQWMDGMIAENYSNATINSYYNTLQTMLRWAVKKRVIERDPFLDVDKLMKKKKNKKIITSDEFKDLFVEDWKTVWDNDYLCCTANKLAALTGMRCGEVLGLKGEYVFDDHIYLAGQFDAYGYRETKTKIKHNIPLTGEMIADLRKLMQVNGDGFIFSLDGGVKPVNRFYLYYGLNKAFNNIGIDKEAIKERGLNIHAWILDVALATTILQYCTAKSGASNQEGSGGYGA
jgi:integrase